MQAFVIINYVGKMISAGVNAKIYLIKDLFGVQVIVCVNMIKCDIEEQKIKIVCENCKCRKKFADKLIEECTQNVKEVKLAKITSAEDKNNHKCSSCTLYIVLFSIILTINVGIGSYFLYFHWYLKKDVTRIKFGTRTQTTI